MRIERKRPIFSHVTGYTLEQICDGFAKVARYEQVKSTLPLRLMLAVGRCCEWLAVIGIKTPVNRERIFKLVHASHVYPRRLIEAGFQYEYDLEGSLADWLKDSGGGEFS